MQTLDELGRAVRAARQATGLTTVEVAKVSGRSRDVLHRLESGRDVSVSSLLDILAAIGQQLELAAIARPTLGDMQRRFAHLQQEAESESEQTTAAPRPRRGRR